MSEAPRSTVAIPGRVLYVTEDSALLEAQLKGQRLPYDPSRKLRDNISTDELTPAWACYYYDETLAEFCLTGLKGGVVSRGAIKEGGFGVIVSGISKGCGSSRETAPYSELAAGVRLVIARSFEKIYRQNAQNIGLFLSTDFGLIERIERGEAIPVDELVRGLDPISESILRHGGLFAYNRARLEGRTKTPAITTPPRPMTLAEKILARHAVTDAGAKAWGVPAVKPGDAFFARADVRFSHEYVTPMAEALFVGALGKDARVSHPESVYAFRDHLTFVDRVLPEAQRALGLDRQAASLAVVQEAFVARHHVKYYGEVERDGQKVGSEAICHNKVIEEIALPGQLVLGTDSHTCMAGALGCYAFGVGSTDMANAWLTEDVRVTVPESARVVLEGKLSPGVSAKDVMLHLLSQAFFRAGEGIGKVLEFTGSGLAALPMDERSTLTNMAVEAGGVTGIMAADEVVVRYLSQARGLPADEVRQKIVLADPDAVYVKEFHVDLGSIVTMVATPGDPRNGVALGALLAEKGEVAIDIAYGGSCTGGKMADMDMYASVLAPAVARGERVHERVRLYIQFGSQTIRRYAESKGYIELFRRAGAELIDPSCGACIKAGPGISERPDQVTVSAINRNFPGRSGPGQVFLASPFVVAASALRGCLAAPQSP
jgi:3-isopropylmalate/(R)-2-methylmalate dehydratase large subunit